MNPYQQGVAAFHAGEGRNRNPYPPATSIKAEWDQGWDDARHDVEEADRLANAESRNAGKGGAP